MLAYLGGKIFTAQSFLIEAHEHCAIDILLAPVSIYTYMYAILSHIDVHSVSVLEILDNYYPSLDTSIHEDLQFQLSH